MPAAPIMGLTFFFRNRFKNFAARTPAAVSRINATRPMAMTRSVTGWTNRSPVMVAEIERPEKKRYKICQFVLGRQGKALKNTGFPDKVAEHQETDQRYRGWSYYPGHKGNRNREEDLRSSGNSFFRVAHCDPSLLAGRQKPITGGWIIGTIAMYVYAATETAPRRWGANRAVRNRSRAVSSPDYAY